MASRLSRLRRAAEAASRTLLVDVQVSSADYRVQIVGRWWWRKRGYYNVYVPGRMHVGPLRYHKARWWIHRLAWRYADTSLEAQGRPGER